MAETILVRGGGGWVFEMDVPTQDPALERYQAALAKGELRIVDPSTVRKVTSGTEKYGIETRWVDVDPNEPAEPSAAAEVPEPASEPVDEDNKANGTRKR